MDLHDDPAQAAFRSELREWLADNVPAPMHADTLAVRHAAMMDWQRKLHAGGWVGLSWPQEYGGRGLGPLEEAIFSQELARAGAPEIPPLGYLGRPILLYGSDEQRRRYLPPLLAGDELWCQGFSEPDAGSDLAALRTRADITDGEMTVTGQKVWTSHGSFADFCLVLARTSEGERPHEGITCVIVPMDTPGVTVRPIVQTTGAEEFCEVFFDAVTVPADNVVGDLGQGWAIAQATLAYERGAVDIGYQAKFDVWLQDLARNAPDPGDPVARRAVADAAVHLGVLRFHCLRSLSKRASGRVPGPESSIDKLLMTRAEQRLTSAALAVAGASAIRGEDEWFERYLFARAASVYGGTSQIQKNILATRVLDLGKA